MGLPQRFPTKPPDLIRGGSRSAQRKRVKMSHGVMQASYPARPALSRRARSHWSVSCHRRLGRPATRGLTGRARPLYSAGFATSASCHPRGRCPKAPVAELVDALDSKSSSARSAGSIPARGTRIFETLVRCRVLWSIAARLRFLVFVHVVARRYSWPTRLVMASGAPMKA